MTTLNGNEISEAEISKLKGMRILLVEDTWYVGVALKRQLQILGLEVDGPVATTADAERIISSHPPDTALVDFNLRGGEKADSLIDKLHEQGISVVVITGYATLPLKPENVAAILRKPFNEAQLVKVLCGVRAQKSSYRGVLPH